MEDLRELAEQYGLSEEEVKKAVERFKRMKEYAKQRRYQPSPEAKERMKVRYRKNRIREQLLIAKARDAGITVTDEEVEAIYQAKYGSESETEV